jgi:hypothetical protein
MRDEHAISIYYNPYKKVLIIGNTGYKGLGNDEKSGLHIYSTEGVPYSSLSELFVFMLDHYSHDFYSEFYHYRKKKLGAPIQTLVMPSQISGNCVFRSQQLILLSLLLIDQIPKEKVNIKSEWVKKNDNFVKFADFLTKTIDLAFIERYLSLESKSKSPEILSALYHYDGLELNPNWEMLRTQIYNELREMGQELPQVGIFNYQFAYVPTILSVTLGSIYTFYKGSSFLCKKVCKQSRNQ